MEVGTPPPSGPGGGPSAHSAAKASLGACQPQAGASAAAAPAPEKKAVGEPSQSPKSVFKVLQRKSEIRRRALTKQVRRGE